MEFRLFSAHVAAKTPASDGDGAGGIIFSRRDRLTLGVLLTLCLGVVLWPGTDKRTYQAVDAPGNAYRFQVDINRAPAAELRTLPGIGEKLADAIVLSRQAHGKFMIPRDIRRVKGIGEKKLAAIEPFLLFPSDDE